MSAVLAPDALRHRVERLLSLAVEWTGPGTEQGRQAADLLGVPFGALFAERWADAMKALETKLAIWDGSMPWSQRYAFAELRGHGDPGELAMDMSLGDLSGAVDDLLALGRQR